LWEKEKKKKKTFKLFRSGNVATSLRRILEANKMSSTREGWIPNSEERGEEGKAPPPAPKRPILLTSAKKEWAAVTGQHLPRLSQLPIFRSKLQSSTLQKQPRAPTSSIAAPFDSSRQLCHQRRALNKLFSSITSS
jgi:hypothetical protein